MRLLMEQKAYGSSPGPVKSDTMLQMAHHRWDISLRKTLLCPGTMNSLHATAYFSQYNQNLIRFLTLF